MSGFLDIIILLMILVVIFMRLRNILGTRPDNQIKVKIVTPKEFEEVYSQIRKNNEAKENNELKEQELSELDLTLNTIPNFSRAEFCKRAQIAFEMVLKAFASADEKTLKMLVGKKLLNKFEEILSTRRDEGITAETDLIRIEDMSIEDASVSPKGIAHIVVKFISEQINLLKNAAGEVIEGDENFIQKITDVWTFERNINSDSPVWLLVSTKKGKA